MQDLYDLYRCLALGRYSDALIGCERLPLARRRAAEAQLIVQLANRGLAAGTLDAEGHSRFAAELQRVGLYAEAASEYRHLLRLAPGSPEIHNNLGTALQAHGDVAGAGAAFEAALRLRPDYPRALSNLGGLRLKSGQMTEACRLLERAVSLDPAYAAAWINLGAAQRASGQSAAAAVSCRRALDLRRTDPAAHLNLANALSDLGQIEEALASCDEGCRLDPNSGVALALKAVLLARLDRLHESDVVCAALMNAGPVPADSALELCRQLALVGRGQIAAAVARRAVEHAPAHRNLRLEAFRLHVDLRQFSRALPLIEPLLDGAAEATVLSEAAFACLADARERLDERGTRAAIGLFERALALEPDRAAERLELGVALSELGETDRALAQIEAAQAADPENSAAAAALLGVRSLRLDWRDHGQLLNILRAGIERGDNVAPMMTAMRFDDPALVQKSARSHVRKSGLVRGPRRAAAPRTRLRIGYLSPDFNMHPVAHAIAPVLERHDRSCVEVVGIATGADDGSTVAKRIRAACDRFEPAAMNDPDLLDRKLRELDLDILVDLVGHTRGARDRAMAACPAPIQVSYLGYPGTLGAPWADYLMVDRYVVPPEALPYYDEAIVWLPDTFLAGERPAWQPADVPPRSAVGLPEKGFVFCNFNQPERIAPAAFDLFVRILHRVPDSLLWMRDPGEAGAARLRERFAQGGLDASRLVFAKHAPSREAHFARLGRADLFLDTLPYNAHTTAREALGAGVPVLTCSGAAFAARVAGSLLTSLGADELVTTTAEDFEHRAMALAGDPARLSGLRRRIAAAMDRSTAFNAERQARQLERAFLTMHARALAGRPPGLLELSAP